MRDSSGLFTTKTLGEIKTLPSTLPIPIIVVGLATARGYTLDSMLAVLLKQLFEGGVFVVGIFSIVPE